MSLLPLRTMLAGDPIQVQSQLQAALAGHRAPLLPVPVEDGQRLLAGIDLTAPVAEGTAVVVATSGSTGIPKAAMLPAAALLASAHATLARLGGPGQWLLALPVSSVAGVQVLTRSIVAGTRPVPAFGGIDALPAAIAAMTGTRRYAALVPTQLRRALRDQRATAALASLDAVLLGAAAAGAGLLLGAAAAGIAVVTTYGMTETCGGCVYDGRPLDGVAIRVLDAAGLGLDVSSPGRIELHGPTLFAGYLGRPDLSEAALHDGWLRTHDRGTVDADGRLDVLGRVDDVVVSGGVNIALTAVAARLSAHPAVEDAVCIGVPDPEWGTAVVAFVVAAPRHPGSRTDIDRAAVRDWVAATLGAHQVPRRVVTLPSLPMLPNGKVDLPDLRSRL